MKVPEFLSASSRRAIMAVGLAAVLCATSGVRAQPCQDAPKPQEPAKPAEVDVFKLTQSVPTLIIYQIKPDRAADFEAFWAGLRAALAKSEKEDVKAVADTLQPLKVQLPPGSPVSVFVFKLETPSLTISYSPIQLAFFLDTTAIKREDAEALFKKFDGSYTGYSVWPLLKTGS